jgi:charged multivesicular body protein 4A/B
VDRSAPSTVANKSVCSRLSAAKAALRKKKTYEHQLEQTQAHILTVEREISSIETANINKETLDAMKNASKAMKNIHGGLTIEKVDETMEQLREQHAVGDVRATRDLRRNSAFGSKCVCLFVAFGSAYSMSFGCSKGRC